MKVTNVDPGTSCAAYFRSYFIPIGVDRGRDRFEEPRCPFVGEARQVQGLPRLVMSLLKTLKLLLLIRVQKSFASDLRLRFQCQQNSDVSGGVSDGASGAASVWIGRWVDGRNSALRDPQAARRMELLHRRS